MQKWEFAAPADYIGNEKPNAVTSAILHPFLRGNSDMIKNPIPAGHSPTPNIQSRGPCTGSIHFKALRVPEEREVTLGRQ